MTGTGLKKCMPANCCLRDSSTSRAISSTTKPEVFEAIRPNGERRNFLVPTASLTPEQAQVLDDDPGMFEGTDDE